MNVAATLDLATAASIEWDVLVVGAGPAGAVTARGLARLGAHVLLVDQAAFPRRKVCGACLIQRGVDALERIGLGDLPQQHGGIPLTSVQLSARYRHARFPGPGGVALSREVFDAALVQSAIAAGAHFLPEAPARIHENHSQYRTVQLQRLGDTQTVRARLVVAADGLGGLLLAREPGLRNDVKPAARIGVGCTLVGGDNHYEPGTIYMACGQRGYLGLVRLEGGRLNCAAALDRKALRNAAAPASVIGDLLHEAGLPPPAGLESAVWRGTMPLTRTPPRTWSHRLFVVGDAAGYVEPFTGEGMAWAIASAVALAPIALAAAKSWDARLGNAWQQQHRKLVRQRERFLRAAAVVLRHPHLTSAIVALLAQFPIFAAPLMRHLRRRDSCG
ncbi:MAG TPA: FAD-dependent monooxygenase [Gemmataceae bacterium]|jgi:flavin-dependent dehydrogenase|nr:FAD-dependent monooxygenase [Gemmataceae bacterium]